MLVKTFLLTRRTALFKGCLCAIAVLTLLVAAQPAGASIVLTLNVPNDALTDPSTPPLTEP